jgi:dTDP-4-dehydrorhamnose reductase
MRLLVFGGWGQLGSDLAIVADQHGHELIRPRHGEVDVTDRAGVLAAADANHPDAVITTAAFHKMEQTEADPVQTFAVNTIGARYVAEGARAAGLAASTSAPTTCSTASSPTGTPRTTR